jgi:ABC-2 type transport system permease protein
VARKEESLIGAVTFLQLPLTFLSTAFMQASLMPAWMGTVADYNPVNWAVVAGREGVQSGTDWATVAGYNGLLAAFALACMTFATRAFRAYQAKV